MTWTNQTKNISDFKMWLKHGNETILKDLENFIFNDVVFPDGKILKDLTFEDLQTQVWNFISKANYSGAQADFALSDYAIVGTDQGWIFQLKN